MVGNCRFFYFGCGREVYMVFIVNWCWGMISVGRGWGNLCIIDWINEIIIVIVNS